MRYIWLRVCVYVCVYFVVGLVVICIYTYARSIMSCSSSNANKEMKRISSRFTIVRLSLELGF